MWKWYQYLSLCVHGSMCICISVCAWCAIYKPSIFGMYAKWAKKLKSEILKIHNFKNIMDRCITSGLWVAPV